MWKSEERDISGEQLQPQPFCSLLPFGYRVTHCVTARSKAMWLLLVMCVGAKYVKRHSKPGIMSAKYGLIGATQYVAMMTNKVLTVASQQFLYASKEM